MSSLMSTSELRELLESYRHLDNEAQARNKIISDFCALMAELHKTQRSEKHYIAEVVHFAASCERAEAERDKLRTEVKELQGREAIK